jgi:hypothetical protein
LCDSDWHYFLWILTNDRFLTILKAGRASLCRRARSRVAPTQTGKRRFREDAQWAYPVLARLLERALIETDGLGHYRIVAASAQAKKRKRWISPHVKRILERSSRDFTEVLDEAEDHQNAG